MGQIAAHGLKVKKMPKKDPLTDRRQKKWGASEHLPGGHHGLWVSRDQFNHIQTPKMPAFDAKWNSHWQPVLPSEILYDGPKQVLFTDRRTHLAPTADLPKHDLRPPIKTPPNESPRSMLEKHLRSFGYTEPEIRRERNKENWRKKKKD